MQENNKERGQLNQEERIEIYGLRKQGISLRDKWKAKKTALVRGPLIEARWERINSREVLEIGKWTW